MAMISRRKIIGAAGQLAAASYLGNAFAGSVEFILGYTDKNTYHPGDSVQIRLNPSATFAATYTAGTLYPSPVTTGWKLIRVADGAYVMSGAVTIQPSVVASPSQDQNWPLSLLLSLPFDLVPGIYHFRCDESNFMVGLYFCVRPVIKSEIIVILPTNTFQAYCNYGGKSMYGYNSFGGNTTKVSFNRPMSIPFYESLIEGADMYRWLQSNFSCDFATDRDLHNDATLLTGYKSVVLVQHSEYWSRPMRDNLETYLRAKGNVTCLSGNTIFWCVRYEDSGNSMYCARMSPSAPDDSGSDKAILWLDKGWSAKKQLGCGFDEGAASTDTANPLIPVPATVYNANHWVYNGTNVSNGDKIGVQEGVARYEVDGVALEWTISGPKVKANTGTDSSFVILGVGNIDTWTPYPAGSKNWTIGYLTSSYGGKIFNAASVNVARAFSSSFITNTFTSPFVTMTKNFLAACTNMQLIEFRTPNPIKNVLSPNASNGYLYIYRTEAEIIALNPTIQNNVRSIYTLNATYTESGNRLNLPLQSRAGAVPLYRHSTTIIQPGSRYPIYKEILTRTASTSSANWRNEGVVAYVFASNVTNSRAAHLFVDATVPSGTERLAVVNALVGRETYSGVKFYCY